MADIDYRETLIRVLTWLEVKKDEGGEWEWSAFGAEPTDILSPEVLAWWEPCSKRAAIEAEIAKKQRWMKRHIKEVAELQAELEALP